jgi:CRISPR-associated protein Cmr1
MAAPELTFKPSDTITEVRTYDIITPLFGGGVEPGQPDPISVVRASEVRGQLRFWWRATRGGQFGGDLQAMRNAELALWGGAATFDQQGKPETGQSLVHVIVKVINEGTDEAPFVVENRKVKERTQSGVPAYAAFPLQPSDEELRRWQSGMQVKTVRVGVSFQLNISFPEKSRKEVYAALWAWETFGGLGARTRRGFGALRLTKIGDQAHTDLPPPQSDKATQWLRKKLAQHIPSSGQDWPKHVPHLSTEPRLKVLSNPDGRAGRAWLDVVTALRKFRQQRRNKNQINAFGHSDWPEPNAIRAYLKRPARGPHEQRKLPKFPRAQFGLPIVFHMAHDDKVNVTLQGARIEASGKQEVIYRLASPLILKPLACSEQKALGLAVILEGVVLPEQLTLNSDLTSPSESPPVVSAELTSRDTDEIPPMKGKGTTNVLDAFLSSLS